MFKSENLRVIMAQTGLKLKEVAEATGVTRVTVSNWRTGRSRPYNRKVLKLSTLFGVKPEYFAIPITLA